MSLPARIVTTAVAAGLLAVAVPLSAAAAPASYAPNKPDTWDRTIVPQTFVNHSVPNDTFDPGARLSITVTGESPAPSLAAFTASHLGGTIAADSRGGALVKLDFGASTRGVYDVTVSEAGTDNYSYGVVTVIPAAAAADVQAADPGALAQTGTTIDVGVLWGAGAAVAAGLVLWVVSRLRRRTR